ncbi:MAG TPA: hypothetical protein PLN94_16265, partial [Thiolinea sp.]|nr:hypothetical protein [Thiolinea sp.]
MRKKQPTQPFIGNFVGFNCKPLSRHITMVAIRHRLTQLHKTTTRHHNKDNIKMKKSLFFTLLSTALFSISTAHAGGGSIFGEGLGGGGMYVGGNYGQATTNCMLSDLSSAYASVSSDPSEDLANYGIPHEEDCSNPGWKVYGGYKIMDNLAIEGGYYNLGDTDESFAASDGKNSASIQATGEASG